MRSIKHICFNILALIICAICFSVASAQSTDQNFPTAVTTNEIDGRIKARDIGDSRLTSYFYTFDGGQGDVFINVVTKNFTGDIDVFTVDGLRPLTKMVIYADGGGNETGRIVYMRKAERLILRIEGRSPNDDPASFKIKFAGSFIALSNQKSQDAPTIKGNEVVAESGVRVNSVGTIVEVLPKPQSSPKATPESKESVPTTLAKSNKPDARVKPTPAAKPAPKKENKETVATTKTPETKPASVKPPAKTPPAKEVARVEKKETKADSKSQKKNDSPEVKTVFKKTPKPVKTTTAEEDKSSETAKQPETAKKNPPDPMASIRLVIQLKDGRIIERPMTEVKKFSVDNGVLIVVARDGSTVKYSILDVAKFTME